MGQAEIMFALGNISSTSAYIVDSKIDIYKNESTFHKAIDEWIQRDPFLQCRVHKANNEYYFSQVPDDELVSKRDVKMLKLSRPVSAETETEIWKGFVELQPSIDIDAVNGMSWRLAILELNKKDNGTFSYLITFTFLHSLSEGRGQARNLQQLLAIFESLILGKSIDQPEKKMVPSFESLLIEKFGHANKTLLPNLINYNQDEYINKWKTGVQKPRFSFEANDAILNINGNVYMPMSEFAKKLEESDSRFRTLLVDSDKYGPLLAECKANGAKFNGCLNLIISLTLRSFLKKLSGKIQDIAYIMLVSHREIFNLDKDKYSSLGFFITEFNYVQKESFENLDPDAFRKKFWAVCKEESKATHEYVESNRFNRVDLNALGENGKMFAHFISSNIGVIPSSLTDEKLVEFVQRYIHFHICEAYLFMFGACSINQRLSVSVLFPGRFIGTDQADEFIQMMNDIIDTLIKQ